jgi:hypothetical protein
MKNSIIFATAKRTFKQTRSRSMSSKKENNVERTGVAQVKSRQLDIEVPESEIIIGGVELYKD